MRREMARRATRQSDFASRLRGTRLPVQKAGLMCWGNHLDWGGGALAQVRYTAHITRMDDPPQWGRKVLFNRNRRSDAGEFGKFDAVT